MMATKIRSDRLDVRDQSIMHFLKVSPNDHLANALA